MPAAENAALASALDAGNKPGAGLFTSCEGWVPWVVVMVWPPRFADVAGTVRTTDACARRILVCGCPAKSLTEKVWV